LLGKHIEVLASSPDLSPGTVVGFVVIARVVLIPELVEVVVHVPVVLPELFLSHGSPEFGVHEVIRTVLVVVFPVGVVTRLGAAEVGIIASVVISVDPALLMGSHREVTTGEVNVDPLTISVVRGVGVVVEVQGIFTLHLVVFTLIFEFYSAVAIIRASVPAFGGHTELNTEFHRAVIWVVAFLSAVGAVARVVLLPESVEVVVLVPVLHPEVLLSHLRPELSILEFRSAVVLFPVASSLIVGADRAVPGSVIATVVHGVDPAFLVSEHGEVTASQVNVDILASVISAVVIINEVFLEAIAGPGLLGAHVIHVESNIAHLHFSA